MSMIGLLVSNVVRPGYFENVDSMWLDSGKRVQANISQNHGCFVKLGGDERCALVAQLLESHQLFTR